LIDWKENKKMVFLNDGKDVKPYGTLSLFRRHLRRHMEQLALFALQGTTAMNWTTEQTRN
jgi:hypothetical protein